MLVTNDNYRTEISTPKEYKYGKLSGVELLIPVGDRVLPHDKYSISITVNHAATKCLVLNKFTIDPRTCIVPLSMTSLFRGSLNISILVKNNVTKEEKIIGVVFNEK